MKKVFLRKEIVKFLIAFLILYLFVFAVLNTTGWLVKPSSLEAPAIVLPAEEKISPKGESNGETTCVFTEKTDSISIPKIKIEAPLVFLPPLSEKDYISALNRGVVHYPESALPGQEGQTIFLGHSAPLGWPKIRYDWVFSDLNKLEPGDEVDIFYDGCQYRYLVFDKIFLEKGEELSEPLTNSKSVVVLISCWPPGKDIRRIAVLAELAID